MNPVDPFMASAPATGIQRGRGGFLRSKDGAPYVSDPSGATVASGTRKGEVKRLKYGSPSSTGTLIENDVGLTKHKQRNTFLGIGMSEDLREACRALVDMDYSSEEFTKAADTIVVEADKLTRSSLAADRGTHGHLLCERYDRRHDWPDLVDAGESVGLTRDTQVATVVAWHDTLAANGLEVLAIEASCVDDKWRLAGTLDRIVRTTKALTFAKSTGEIVTIPSNTVLILDLKFGKCRKAHPIQIASYAQSVPYDTETEVRGEWPFTIDQTHALIAHGDFGDDTQPVTIELVWVDLAAGRDHGGETVVQAKAWAARDDVFSVVQLPVDVEGVGKAACQHEATTPSTPLADAPDLTASATTGEAACGKPATSPVLSPDPDRLALVDARNTLCPSPDEGNDMSAGKFTVLWDELKALFDGLDKSARYWRGLLIGQAVRRHVPFHVQGGRTERRYYINKAVIGLAIVGDSDDILRELLAHIIGDVALFPGVEPGHALGSLSAVEAERFADHVDAYISPLPAA